MAGFVQRLIDGWQYALHHAMRHAPIETTSAIGSFMVRQNVRFNRPEITAGATRNLKIHHPGISDADITAIIWRYLDNVGRVMAEFSIIDRMIGQNRVRFSGEEKAVALIGREPLLAIVLHTGNWEMIGPALKHIGIRGNSFYEPPKSAVQRRIVEEARQRIGLKLLPPDYRGLREAIQLLRANEVVAIFGDEARGGKTMAPLFGRPPHDMGNLGIAARLARKTNAKIVTCHCERLPGCHFVLHVSEPFALAEGGHDLLSDVKLLNDHIEPIIKANLDRWYYLDDSIGPLT